jgi:hypothetical protein
MMMMMMTMMMMMMMMMMMVMLGVQPVFCFSDSAVEGPALALGRAAGRAGSQ